MDIMEGLYTTTFSNNESFFKKDAAEIESLRAQIAELEAKNERLRMALADTEALEIGTAERCAKLTRQRDEYKADAERYRWLKSQKGLNLSSCGGSWIKGNIKFNASHRLCANGTAYAPYETLDEAIDAAIAAAPKQEK